MLKNSENETKTAPGYIYPNHTFRPNFNEKPIHFLHGLAGHPLFTLPRLLELALTTRRKRPHELYYNAGQNVAIEQRLDEMAPPPPLEEALGFIENSGAWITIHQAQKDADYGELFFQCMREFEQLTGVDFREVMQVEDALIFITSPRRLTPYHIDRECNFLLQICGEKTIHVFDQHDREVLPVTEIERFWTIDNNSAIYKPEFQNRAFTMRLVPGNGIHIPVNAPHWVQNDDNVSISLSVNFHWKDSERANVHRANYFLRRLGADPIPPGRSRVRDAVKNATIAATFVPAVRAARKTVRFGRRLRQAALAR